MNVYLKELVALLKTCHFGAWTCLKDHDAAHDPMNNAVENASDYLRGAV
jgi:hypothetical protein